MAKILHRIGESLGLTSKLMDLQGQEQVPSGVIHAPLKTPAGIKERKAELDREAAEAVARAEAEKQRLASLVETTRSLQGELAKAEQRYRGCSEWLEGVNVPAVKSHAAAIGESFGTHGFGDGANPHWIRGLTESHAVLEYRSDILSGARKVRDEVKDRFEKFIGDNREDLTSLGFFEQA